MALISFDDDPWISAHDACENHYRDIQTQLVTLGCESRTSPMYGQLSAQIRLALKKFRFVIAQLVEQLNKTRREQMITDAEAERRTRQIEILQSRCVQLQNQFNSAIHVSTARNDDYDLQQAKQQLFGNSSGMSRGNRHGEVKSVNWGTESDDEELISVERPSIQQLKQRQVDEIADQDRGLDELSKIISRQKDIAVNLGNEVSLQNDIIDDLGEHIDRTDGRVQQETGQIRTISLNDSTCRYWTVIVVLFIAIIVIACL